MNEVDCADQWGRDQDQQEEDVQNGYGDYWKNTPEPRRMVA